MKEELVVAFFKKHLINTGWTVEQSIQTSYIDKTDFGYIPDILAHKNEDILVGEVKGNEGLREIQTAIGQALSYYSYGGNIIVVIVPENLKLVARSIIKNTCFENGGKISGI